VQEEETIQFIMTEISNFFNDGKHLINRTTFITLTTICQKIFSQ
jgi:hypothetical protein